MGRTQHTYILVSLLCLTACDPVNDWVGSVCSGGGKSCYEPWGSPTENVGQWAGAALVNNTARRNNFAAVILNPERAIPQTNSDGTFEIGFGGSISADNPLTKVILSTSAQAGIEFTKQTKLIIAGPKIQDIAQIIPVGLCPSEKVTLISAQLTTGNFCNARMTNTSGRLGAGANYNLDGVLSRPTSSAPTPGTGATALDASQFRPTCPPTAVQDATAIRGNSNLKISPIAVGNAGQGILNAQLGAQFNNLSSSTQQGSNLFVGYKRAEFDCSASVIAPQITSSGSGPFTVSAPDASLVLEAIDMFEDSDKTKWLRLNVLRSLDATGLRVADLARPRSPVPGASTSPGIALTVDRVQQATQAVGSATSVSERRRALQNYDTALRNYEEASARRAAPTVVTELSEIERLKSIAPSCNDYVNFGLASGEPSSRLGICKLKVGELFGVPDRAGTDSHSGWVVFIQWREVDKVLDFQFAKVRYKEVAK